MADQPVTIEKLINADKDVQTIEDFIKKPKDETVTTRFGDEIMTLKGLEEEVKKSGGYFKRYATLAAANADIANIPVNSVVKVTDAVDGGDYEKAAAEATSLTKSPYDPLTQATSYTDTTTNTLSEEIKSKIDTMNVSDLVFGVRDTLNRLAPFPQTGLDGNPTDDCASSMYASMQRFIVEAIGIEVGELGFSLSSSDDYILQLVDKNGKRSCLELGSDGLWSSWAVECMQKQLDLSVTGGVPTQYKSTYQDKEYNIVSGKDLVFIGDSMTQGAGATTQANRYPDKVVSKLAEKGISVNWFNYGVGGENSATIASRVGAYPFMISIDDNVLPADTSPVRVTIESSYGSNIRPLLQNWTNFDGMLNGIPVNLNLVEPNGTNGNWNNDNYYTIARKTAATTATTIDRPVPFYVDMIKPYLGDIFIIWVGQNNGTAEGNDYKRAIADSRAIVDKMQALDKRYIVCSRAGGTSSQDTEDAEWFAEFGRHFVATRQYMVKYGLADAGITPTSQDLTDISNGTVPTSLRSDGIHWNNTGQDVFANLIANKLIELEYV